MSSNNDVSVLKVSSSDIPESERVTTLRDFYCRGTAKAELEIRDGEPIIANLTAHSLPDAHLLLGTLFGAKLVRSRQLVVDDGDDSLAFVFNRSGTIGVTGRGRDLLLGPGDAVLASAEDATTFERFVEGDCFSLRVPRRVLAPIIMDVDDAVMRVIRDRQAEIRVLVDYAASLVREHALATPALRELGAGHLHDLLALVLGPTDDIRESAGRRGAKAARLRKAKFLIVNNCWRQDISVAGVAQELGVTPRYLQRLFEADGRTFSSFLIEQRLKRAHRMLREPEFAERPVSSIAYDVGFGDLSYFNRSFRRAYGATPSDVRSGAAE
ncbi:MULTISPECIES: AraC family transcriptional regulator [unclassified Bradyrhizobium]|uniref:AraC family transcriptional regulator n=1 Tax=unclassified Bradyrhizobium TaxID=2631580 RepID=UPI0020B38371|nr:MULTISPECIES: AraC family transcriptional regulator [unclassified Bradyrhizobium]MCP3382405.1 AraC family transcriptional regulator [Bradyrhizobium sp. CCGUVB4N]MCP3443486.1 AraC family transcriptional regulator [Bradyrhizobium sp. CCGUVB14]WFU77965.1 AraC family transcriptional regulator [Bradyrhizobium sp. CIAT3101]